MSSAASRGPTPPSARPRGRPRPHEPRYPRRSPPRLRGTAWTPCGPSAHYGGVGGSFRVLRSVGARRFSPRYRSMLLLGHAAVSARRGPRGTNGGPRPRNAWWRMKCGVVGATSDSVGAFCFAVSRLCRETSRHFGDGWGFWPLPPFRSSSLFLMLDEKPLVFAGVHTQLICA